MSYGKESEPLVFTEGGQRLDESFSEAESNPAPKLGERAQAPEGPAAGRVSTTLPDVPVVVSGDEQEATRRWLSYERHVLKWYYRPDLEAVRVAMSVALSHRIRESRPCWLMVLGSSGTGKTELILNSLKEFPDLRVESTLSRNSFLSGLPKSKGGTSILEEIGTPKDRSGCLLFPDFTTLVSKHPQEVAEIAGQLREIFDGRFSKTTGAGKKKLWEGKLTLIACATPAVESHWARHREMGERFVQVRWRREDGVEMGRMARRHVDNEQEIRFEMTRLGAHFMFGDQPLNFPTLDKENADTESGVIELAEMAAMLRAHVKRDDKGSRAILEVAEPEGNTRLTQAVYQIARCHAALFRRPEITRADFFTASRIAIDSMPATRLHVVRNIPEDITISQPDLILNTRLPKQTIVRLLEDMEALNVVRVNRDGAQNEVEFTPRFRQLMEKSMHLWKR